MVHHPEIPISPKDFGKHDFRVETEMYFAVA